MSFLSRAHVLSLFDERRERATELVRRFVEPVPGTELVPGTTVPGTRLSSAAGRWP
jgi:hypothetical protein